MALAKIDEIFVYLDPVNKALESQELSAWLDHSNIPHLKLTYYDVEQQKIVLDAVNTWWQPDDNGDIQPPLTAYPFVIYTEIHSDKPISYLPRKYIFGKDDVISKLLNLYKLGR